MVRARTGCDLFITSELREEPGLAGGRTRRMPSDKGQVSGRAKARQTGWYRGSPVPVKNEPIFTKDRDSDR